MNTKKYFLPLILPIIILIFIIYLSYTPPNATAAESGRWEKSQLISELIYTIPILAFQPNIAVDKGGNAIVLWELQEGKQINIWATRYVKGKGWEKATIIEKIEDSKSISISHFAVDGEGNALVIWKQPTGAKISIWAKQYDVTKGWLPAEPIEINTKAFGLDAASDEKGNAILIWEQQVKGRGEYSIWTKRYEAGMGWHPAGPIETGSIEPSGVQIVMEKDGNAMIVFSKDHHSVYAKQYEIGKGWNKAQLIQKETKESCYPKIILTQNNDFLVACIGSSSWINHYKVNKGWDVAKPIGTPFETTNMPTEPIKFTIDASGNIFIVWYRLETTRESSVYRIFAKHYKINEGWKKTELVAEASAIGYGNYITHPNLVTDMNGNALVTWSQGHGLYNNHSIWIKHYETEKGWGIAKMIEINGGELRVNNSITADKDGNFIIVWRRQEGVKHSIWATRFVKEK